MASCSLMVGWTRGVPMSFEYGGYQTVTPASFYTTTYATTGCYTTKVSEYYITTYDAPNFYSEASKYNYAQSYSTKAAEYYSTKAAEVQFHYTSTCAAPSYYTEAPKYYTKAAEYYTTYYASGSYYKGIPNY
ncbi:hypothetical protein DAPPUDRAFT_239114 [Daphnia pulex]|uniref:Uncharacterized protein n=1 Tax=Daphnia pulex TaxID=6669 RepID=E9G8D4_DAPPU|nr:hypothetical protein DAPPUDRAFT_239114 [Daphnia pulex]|eukprot:EFX84292.1 hypothetical protein DAPPUDRAFT_239114 [Daphnia pulex]